VSGVPEGCPGQSGGVRRTPEGSGEPRRGAPDNQERLAAEQAALVRALVGGGPVPGGFDPERVRATSAALARKRAREVARAWPVLAAELGDDFTGRFLAFAAGRPPPARGGALADGLAFARALARQGRLPGDARVEALVAAAHLSRSPARLAAALAGPPRRLVIVIRAPGLGRPLALASPRLTAARPPGWATVV
jgi:hypothetical protein